MADALKKSLALESALLQRLLSRNAAQHRGSLHHKRALELSRLLRLLREVDEKDDDDAAASSSSPLPTHLSRLAATSRLCAAVSRTSRALASSCSGQLAHGFFVPLCSALVAVAARCAAASAALSLESARGYNRGVASFPSVAKDEAKEKKNRSEGGGARALPPRILWSRAMPVLLSVSFPGRRAGAPLVSGVGGGLAIAEEEGEKERRRKGAAASLRLYQPPLLVLPPPPSAASKKKKAAAVVAGGDDDGDDLGVPVSRIHVTVVSAAAAAAASPKEEEERAEATSTNPPPALPVFIDTAERAISGERGEGKEREEGEGGATNAKEIIYESSAPLLGSVGAAKRPAAAPPPLLETKSAAKRRTAKAAAAARRQQREAEEEGKAKGASQMGWESWIDVESLRVASTSNAGGFGNRGLGGGGGGKRRKM